MTLLLEKEGITVTEHKFIDNIEYKKCSCCKEFKTLSNFQKRKDSKDGYRDKCITCLNIVKQAWLNQPVENITHKICTKCKKDKLTSEYTKNNSSIDGYSYVCKDCAKFYRQQNREQIQNYNLNYNNKTETKEYRKNYYQQYKLDYPEKIKKNNENSLNYYYQNKESILTKQKEQYKLKNLDCIQEAEQRRKQKEQLRQEQLNKKQEQLSLLNKGLKKCNVCNNIKQLSEFYVRKSCLDGYSGQCKSCELERQREYENNLTIEQKEHKRERHKIYAKEHKDKLKLYQREYRKLNKISIQQFEKQRYLDDKINKDISVLLNKSLKGHTLNWSNNLSYSLQQLKEHLEKQFDDKMNWENYGSYWEIDHIIPKNQFNIQTESDVDFQVCWSLANLRPIEKIKNRLRPKDGSDISEDQRQQILKGVK